MTISVHGIRCAWQPVYTVTDVHGNQCSNFSSGMLFSVKHMPLFSLLYKDNSVSDYRLLLLYGVFNGNTLSMTFKRSNVQVLLGSSFVKDDWCDGIYTCTAVSVVVGRLSDGWYIGPY